jgi:tetratricopeptide (TPR) repeat protein
LTSDYAGLVIRPAEDQALAAYGLNMQLSKTETLRQAQQFIEGGRVSSAIRLYQSVIEADPSDLAVITLLGEAYAKAGRIQDAVEHLLRIAENYLSSGSAISATHLLKKVLRLDPLAARAHMHLGELYLSEGRINHAHASFIEAGAAFWHKGNTASAIRMNELALASIPDSRQAKTALALLEQEINQRQAPPAPKPATGEVEQILISIADDEPDAMCPPVSTYDSQPALPSNPADSPSSEEPPECMGEDAIVEQIAIAEMLVGNGQAVQAVALLRETLHHKPDHIQIRAKLKDIYLRTEMIDRASEECLNIAAIYAARDDHSRARDYVLRARVLANSIDRSAPLAQQNGAAEAPREEGVPWIPESREPLRVM